MKAIANFWLKAALALMIIVLLMSGAALANDEKPCAIGMQQYDSLQAAIDSVAENGQATITIRDSIALTAAVKVEGGRDITLSGGTITRGKNAENWYTGTLFTVAAGSSLAFDDGLIVDSGNQWTFLRDAYYADLSNNQKSISTAYALPEEGAPVSSAAACVVKGTLSVNRATFQNQYGGNLFKVNDGGTLNMNSGALMQHVTSGGSVVASVDAGGVWNLNEGAKITDNHAMGGNGGVASVRGKLYIKGGEICGNTTFSSYSSSGSGVAFMLHESGEAHMSGGRICHNATWYGGWGGVIYVHYGSATKFYMTGGVIEENLSTTCTGIVSNGDYSIVSFTGGTLSHTDNGRYSTYILGNFTLPAGMTMQNGIIRIYGNVNIHSDTNTRLQIYGPYSGSTPVTVNGTAKATGGIQVKATSNVVIESGTYLGPIDNSAGGKLLIKAGTYSDYDNALIHLDEGLGLGDNKNGTWTVGPAFAITCDLQQGTADDLPTQYVTGYEYSLPNPTREGYTFLGWTGSNGNTPQKNLRIARPGRGAVNYVANWRLGEELDTPILPGGQLGTAADVPPSAGDDSLPVLWCMMAMAAAAAFGMLKRRKYH